MKYISIYIYVYVSPNLYIHIHIHIHIHKYIHIYIYIYLHTQKHIYIDSILYMHVCVCFRQVPIKVTVRHRRTPAIAPSAADLIRCPGTVQPCAGHILWQGRLNEMCCENMRTNATLSYFF